VLPVLKIHEKIDILINFSLFSFPNISLKKSESKLMKLFTRFLLLLFCLPLLINAQKEKLYTWDDPTRDQVPLEVFKNFTPDKSASSVITINNYDNFFLGVDFAEPHMSVNPLNPLEYFNAFNTNGTHYTYDGFEWAAATPSFGNTMRGDPVTAYDSQGNLYYMNMYGSSSIAGSLVMKSTNNGATWGSSVVAVSGADKCWIAADQTDGPYSGYIYAVMTASGSGGNFSRSTNSGASFTQTNNFSTQSLPGMMVAVGANVLNENNISGGCVYVVTNGGDAFNSTYTIYCSTNGGTSFSQKSSVNFANTVGTQVSGRNSVENMRTRPYPFIAADNSNGPFRGRLYLVYASNNPPGNGNKPDIFCRFSIDQGASWSEEIRINDDPNSTNNHQFMPAIWCDINSGKLFAQWMDTRDVPTHDSCYIYATYSDNGGVTFKPNQKISNKKMKIDCATCGGGGTPRYQGDYNAISSDGDISLAVWADFRDGQFGSFTGYFPDYALDFYPGTQFVLSENDTANFTVSVPSTKLYAQSVSFDIAISPEPQTGTFLVEYPGGSNTLNVVPDLMGIKIIPVNNVTEGDYTVTLTGTGPSGIPIHKRTAMLTVEPAAGGTSVVSVNQGWNIVSVPRQAQSMNLSALFPQAVSQAFSFNNGYVASDPLENGKGYWLKFASAASVPVQGYRIADEIPLQTGWNLVGPFHDAVSVNSLTTDPPGLISSVFYGYSDNYFIASMLEPGKGYWVKSSGSGNLLISGSGLQKESFDPLAVIDDENTVRITLRDASGHSATLYLADNSCDLEYFELPPAAPGNTFEARFTGGRFVGSLSENAELEMKHAVYPVTIEVSGTDMKIRQGKYVNSIKDGSTISLQKNYGDNLSLEKITVPLDFSLSQNYPNPFNPETIISFDLPADSDIKLSVYNMLGEEVAVPVSGLFKAGKHDVKFNAAGYSSGVYFYRIETAGFTSTKKMVLAK